MEPLPADGLAYSALLKNELLGAGIEKVQDPQTEDRRLQPSTPEKKGLFTVSLLPPGWQPTPLQATRLGLPTCSSRAPLGSHLTPCLQPRVCSPTATKAALGQISCAWS